MPQPAPLLYYFPRSAKIPAELSGRFSEKHTKSNCGADGPDGGKGLLAAPFSDVYPRLDEKGQKWKRFPKAGYWIGVDNSASPEDFKRAHLVPGPSVALALGLWQIPVANPMVDSCTLEFWEMPDGQGGWELEVKEEFRQLSEYALELAGQLREIMPDVGDEIKMTLDGDEIRTMLARIIQVNYDLTVEEMGALHLFDPATYGPIIMEFVDYPAMIAMIRDHMGAANATLNPIVAAGAGNVIACGGPA